MDQYEYLFERYSCVYYFLPSRVRRSRQNHVYMIGTFFMGPQVFRSTRHRQWSE